LSISQTFTSSLCAGFLSQNFFRVCKFCPRKSAQKLLVKWHLTSISSTFYTRVFCTKFWRQKYKSCVLGLNFFGTKILAQNAQVICWWNWHLGFISPIYLRKVSNYVDPKSKKRQSRHLCLFALLGSKLLVKRWWN